PRSRSRGTSKASRAFCPSVFSGTAASTTAASSSEPSLREDLVVERFHPGYARTDIVTGGGLAGVVGQRAAQGGIVHDPSEGRGQGPSVARRHEQGGEAVLQHLPAAVHRRRDDRLARG